MAGEPPANPFSDKKRNSAGEISKKAKGTAGGGASSSAGQAARLRLRFCAKMGSSESKKSLYSKSPSKMLGDLLLAPEVGHLSLGFILRFIPQNLFCYSKRTVLGLYVETK